MSIANTWSNNEFIVEKSKLISAKIWKMKESFAMGFIVNISITANSLTTRKTLPAYQREIASISNSYGEFRIFAGFAFFGYF